MSPGFETLTPRGKTRIARAPRVGHQLVRLRSLESEIERQLIEHTPKHDPGCAIMILHTLAVRIDFSITEMVRGGPMVKSLFPGATRKFSGNWVGDESRV